MDATVPDLSDEDLSTRGEYPEQWFNEDRDAKREARKDEIAGAIRAADVVGLVDSDTDGLACEVVLREAHDNVHVLQIGGEYGFELFDTVQFVDAHTAGDTELVVADLAPDAAYSGFLGAVAQFNGPVSVYDHHEWPSLAVESTRAAVSTLSVDDSGERCAAQVMQEDRYPDAPAWLVEFLSVTADHDLYEKQDSRSDHLSTLSFVLDRDEYVAAARSHGAEMLEDDDLRATYERAEREAKRRIELAVERADWRTINGVDVAVTYFSCHQSRAGDRLLTQGADVAVIIKPTLKVSFRTDGDVVNAAALAQELGGGGHREAAGAKLYHHLDDGFEATWEQGGANAMSFVWGFLEQAL